MDANSTPVDTAPGMIDYWNLRITRTTYQIAALRDQIIRNNAEWTLESGRYNRIEARILSTHGQLRRLGHFITSYGPQTDVVTARLQTLTFLCDRREDLEGLCNEYSLRSGDMRERLEGFEAQLAGFMLNLEVCQRAQHVLGCMYFRPDHLLPPVHVLTDYRGKGKLLAGYDSPPDG